MEEECLQLVHHFSLCSPQTTAELIVIPKAQFMLNLHPYPLGMRWEGKMAIWVYDADRV